jgi:hypothetical protein
MSYNYNQKASVLPLHRCPHCSIALPRLQKLNVQVQTDNAEKKQPRVWILFECSACGGCVMVAWENTSNSCNIWPAPNGFSDDIPDEPLDYLKQAAETISSPRASVVMSAGAVDSMLKERGLTEGSLYARIKQAVEQHLLTPDMGEWAHDVRLDANDQRHADTQATPPTVADAKRCLEFAKALGDILFVLPARVTRGKKTAHEAAVEAGRVPATAISKAPPPITPLRT